MTDNGFFSSDPGYVVTHTSLPAGGEGEQLSTTTTSTHGSLVAAQLAAAILCRNGEVGSSTAFVFTRNQLCQMWHRSSEKWLMLVDMLRPFDQRPTFILAETATARRGK